MGACARNVRLCGDGRQRDGRKKRGLDPSKPCTEYDVENSGVVVTCDSNITCTYLEYSLFGN